MSLPIQAIDNRRSIGVLSYLLVESKSMPHPEFFTNEDVKVVITAAMIRAGERALFESKTGEWEIGSNVDEVLARTFRAMHLASLR